MKPYHIKSKIFSSWIDLEAIQMISDIILYPDELIKTGFASAGEFCITLAFHDHPIKIEARTRFRITEFNPTTGVFDWIIPTGKIADEKNIKICEEREELLEVYYEVLNAWKSLST